MHTCIYNYIGDRLEHELIDTVGHDPQVALENSIINMDSGGEESSGSEMALMDDQPSVPTCMTADTSITLASIIADGRFLEFHHFLKDDCRTRNLKFWLACKYYRQLSSSADFLTKVARALYHKFIKYSAPQKIHILPKTKSKIKESLIQCENEPLTVELFSAAQQEICEAIEKSEILRFILCEDAQFTCQKPLYRSTYMPNPICDMSVASSYQPSKDSTSLSSFSKG